MLSGFPPPAILYFFYGIAFFILGTSIALKDIRFSELEIGRSLWLLAAFGFTHGTHEWLELYLLLQEPYITSGEIYILKVITVTAVIISFVFLLQFGLALIRPSMNKNQKKWLNGIPVILFFLWIIYLWNYGFSNDIQFFKKADISARYNFGFVGGIVTAYGLTKYSHSVKSISPYVSKKLMYAGFTFLIYGIVSGLIPSHSVLPLLKVRVEVLRGICAVSIAYFIIAALNIFDIESKKKIEHQLKRVAQSEKLLSIGQLAAGIAHEINNPLTNISLSIQMLKDKLKGINNAGAINKLDSIERNVNKASVIARELLQFSRNTEPEMRPLNINRLIRGALTLMQYKFKDMVVHLDLSDVPDIIGSAAKLEQLFINILDNSVEAMQAHDEICIESSYENGLIEVKITDSGVGIPQENLSKLFDPFFTTKEVGMGTGLGLSICYGIITQHKGNIDIKSTQGEGTLVTITLPVESETDLENFRHE